MRLAGPRACVVLALLALLSSPAVARAQGIATLPQGEFLFASPPEGWIVGHRSRQGNASIVEWLLSTPVADGFARRKGWTESGGCLYLRMLTVLPDMGKSIGGPVVVAAALGQGPLGKTGAVAETVNVLARAVADNRPATVIANVSPAAATSPAEDAVKAETDVAALRDLLVERGITPARIVTRPNPSCQG